MGKVRAFVAVILSLAVAMGWADTLVTEAKILEVTERGFILRVGTEPLAVEDSPETKLWKACAGADRKAFGRDESVGVRIKTDTDPPLLREMADAATWQWLTKIRKEPMSGAIEKVTGKVVTVKFSDGRSFEYRYSDKTEIVIGKKTVAASDLEVGQKVYLKGRLLPTLDTWLEKISDEPIPGKATAEKSKKPKIPPPLPATGKLEGMVQQHLGQLRMFDLLADPRLFHITYGAASKFFLDGRPCRPESLAKSQRAVVHYSRDKAGRILASKVELYSPKGG
jgi:hypothetical protein